MKLGPERGAARQKSESRPGAEVENGVATLVEADVYPGDVLKGRVDSKSKSVAAVPAARGEVLFRFPDDAAIDEQHA